MIVHARDIINRANEVFGDASLSGSVRLRRGCNAETVRNSSYVTLAQVLLLVFSRVRLAAATSADLRRREKLHRGAHRRFRRQGGDPDTMEIDTAVGTGMGHHCRTLERRLGLPDSDDAGTELLQLRSRMEHQRCKQAISFKYRTLSS